MPWCPPPCCGTLRLHARSGNSGRAWDPAGGPKKGRKAAGETQVPSPGAHSRTLRSCKMCIDPLGDHVLTCKQHTGSIRGHNHLMDVVASLSHDSKIGPVRVSRKVWTTGDGTRKQGDVEISNFPIYLWDGLVIDVSFVCEFKGSSRAPGGWDNGVRHSNDVLQARANVKNNKYKDVYGLVPTRRLHLPSQVCPVRSTLTFFGFSGFLLTNR